MGDRQILNASPVVNKVVERTRRSIGKDIALKPDFEKVYDWVN